MDDLENTLLGIQRVRARYGDVSTMWIERRLRDDSGFPKPVYIGRLRFWRIAELQAWERTLATKRFPVTSATTSPEAA
jgi:predicted DNA-binding transcriptional regulator AlpA